MPKELSARFRPGWWVFVLGRNEETGESHIIAHDLKRYDSTKDAARLSLESLLPLSWSVHVHYAVIHTRFAHDADHLRSMMLTYELQWNTTGAQHDAVGIRQELDKLRRTH